MPIRSLSEAQNIQSSNLNMAALGKVHGAARADCVMIYTLETETPGTDVHVRMFAPAYGIVEDPATGSGNGALGAYLVNQHVVPVTPPTTHIVSEQGLEINRPSTIYIEVDGSYDNLSAVRVGGQARIIAEGTLSF